MLVVAVTQTLVLYRIIQQEPILRTVTLMLMLLLYMVVIHNLISKCIVRRIIQEQVQVVTKRTQRVMLVMLRCMLLVNYIVLVQFTKTVLLLLRIIVVKNVFVH